MEIISEEEAKHMGLPSGTGLFRELYLQMLDDISAHPYKTKEYGQAPEMTPSEKKISFLNRYFVYKKVRVVNIDNVRLDIEEGEKSAVEETQELQKVAKVVKKVAKKKTTSSAEALKVVKLKKKIVLIQDDEDV
jgi:hypothetical protein